MTTDLRRLIAGRIGKGQRGIEFGPSFNPIAPKSAGFNVMTVDHLSRDGLIAKYRGQSVDLSRMEPVDVIWDGTGDLPGLPAGAFEYVIASHVIEHLPDPVRFLRMCEALLGPTGALYLVVPDKRCCFDHYRPVSTTGQILQAHAEARVRPTGGQVFDHYAFASTVRGTLDWGRAETETPVPRHGVEEAHAAARLVWEKEDYQDVHCWVFTPPAFSLVVSDLRQLGLLGLEESEFLESGGGEFLVVLSRGIPGPGRPRRTDLLREAAGNQGSRSARASDGAGSGAPDRGRLDRPLSGVAWRATRPLRALLRRMPGGARVIEWVASAVGRR